MIDGWNHLPRPISATRWRIHQTTSSLVVLPGVMTLLENASRMTRCATFITWRYASSSSGSFVSSQPTASISADFMRARVLGAERVGQPPLFVGGQAVGVIPGVGFVDADHFRVALLDELPQPLVLRIVVRLHDVKRPS